MKQLLSLLPLCILSFNLMALDRAYFKTLQTERVESTDLVQWHQIGPGTSGYTEEFWTHPTNPDVMFMSPDMYNSYGSWDNGNSWSTIKDVDGDGWDMRRVQSITFSHQQADFGLAIDVRGYLYKTENMGHNWQRIHFPGKGRYSELAVDPTDDNNWYMGAGDFWNVKAHHRQQDRSKDYTYRYSAYGHIYKSHDKGRTWQKITQGLPENLDVGKIIVNPTNTKQLIMAATTGLYLSLDQGRSWHLSGKGLPNNRPRDLTSYYNPKSGQFILYLLEQSCYFPDGKTIKSTGGVFKSLDGGQSWQSITGDLAVDMTKISSKAHRNKYYKTIANWFGSDQIAPFKKKYPQLPESILNVFNRLVINPLNPDEIYLSHNSKHDRGFIPGDVWKTEDGGQHWFATARTGLYWSQKKDAAYWATRGNPEGQNTTYAHLAREQAHREELFGNRLMEVNTRGEVFISLEQQLMRSRDGGQSWQQIDDIELMPHSNIWIGRGGSNLPGRLILTETGIKGRYLFASGEHGLWESTGLHGYPDKMAVPLRQIEGQVHHKGARSIASVAVHPQDPNTIYILMFRQNHRGAFRQTTDGGKTWRNLSTPLALPGNQSMEHLFQYSLTIAPDQPEQIYFTAIANPIAEVSAPLQSKYMKKFGVYKSKDGGKSWSVANQGIPAGSSIRRIKMDPKNSSVLYAAANEGLNGAKGGLYKTNDSAQSWHKIAIPEEIQSVNNLFIDHNNGSLYISCGRSQGSLKEGGVWRSTDKGQSWQKIFAMPYIWQTEVSPINPKLIMVNVAQPRKNRDGAEYNPGAYLSLDGGQSWNKINNNLGQPNTITDLRPDPYREDVFWCALKGSGWAIGYRKGVTQGWALESTANENTIKTKRENQKLEH